MIRVLADDISKTSGRPTRSQLADVASKIVSEYPKSFQDNLDDAIVGTGYNSILTQLEHRFQNINRTVKPTKRPNSPNSLDSNKSKKRKRGASTSSYGSIAKEYQPELPEEEDESTQDLKKEALKDIYSSRVWNLDDLKGYLDETYPTVRLLINEGSQSITTLKKEWPFLFEKVGMLHHFERLVGIEVQETLTAALVSKLPRIMQFMNAKQTTSKPLRKILKEIEAAKREDDTNNPDIIGLLLLLATFFGEDTRDFIHVEEETSLEADIDKDTLPVTPCIIALGTSAVTSKCFMLVIDREILSKL
ncbi:uncharacterized protein LOC117100416 [Anneissia japonica]|uniref:uncharacterized protein LOC117100416 n=1 Tax=Anneissia japonica TaxID=1529436 RepID=UPI0014254B82|nr:uncharacterized protein LOC117100416 [Anneissia japonica]